MVVNAISEVAKEEKMSTNNIRFLVGRGLVAGSRQLYIMTLIVGSFVFLTHLDNTQEPISEYQIYSS